MRMAARRRQGSAPLVRRRKPRGGPKLGFSIRLPEHLGRLLIRAAADALTTESEIVGDLVEAALVRRRPGSAEPGGDGPA
jgi:hypothetical protein